MELVNLRLSAREEYSKYSLEENRWLKYDSFKEIEYDIPEYISVFDRNRVYSEVLGKVEVTDILYTDESIKKFGVQRRDGVELGNELEDIYELHGLNFNAEEEEIQNYIDSLEK